MMGENLSGGSIYHIIDQSQKQQRISTFNKGAAVGVLSSSTLISTTKNPMNKGNNNAMFVFLFSVIGLSLLSLSASATMANAQAPSNTTSGTNSTSNETGVKQMGICQVGAGGPCNGDSNSAK
jgi:ATP/ADP translocase